MTHDTIPHQFVLNPHDNSPHGRVSRLAYEYYENLIRKFKPHYGVAICNESGGWEFVPKVFSTYDQAFNYIKEEMTKAVQDNLLVPPSPWSYFIFRQHAYIHFDGSVFHTPE